MDVLAMPKSDQRADCLTAPPCNSLPQTQRPERPLGNTRRISAQTRPAGHGLALPPGQEAHDRPQRGGRTSISVAQFSLAPRSTGIRTSSGRTGIGRIYALRQTIGAGDYIVKKQRCPLLPFTSDRPAGHNSPAAAGWSQISTERDGSIAAATVTVGIRRAAASTSRKHRTPRCGVFRPALRTSASRDTARDLSPRSRRARLAWRALRSHARCHGR